MKKETKYKISPKGKRQLDYKPRPSKPTKSSIKLPLIGKTVYLDVKDSRHLKRLQNDLKKLGATLEDFVSRDINYLITTQPRPKKVPVPCGDDNPTPSPFNCDPSPSPSNPEEKKVSSVPRGKALVEKARVNTRKTSTLLDNAEKWGVKIVGIEGAFKWIDKELKKLPRSSVNASKNSTKDRCVSSYKTFKLPFVKIEAENFLYRPFHTELESWPHLNTDTPRGSCPFDGTLIKGDDESREERGELLVAQVDIPSEETPKEEKDAICSPVNSVGAVKVAEKSGRKSDSDIFGGGKIMTAGELKRRKELKRKQERKKGYCECCHTKYEDLDKHVCEEQHRQYVKDKSNYHQLDELITSGPSCELFLYDYLNKAAAMKSRRRKEGYPSASPEKATEDLEVRRSPRKAVQEQTIRSVLKSPRKNLLSLKKNENADVSANGTSSSGDKANLSPGKKTRQMIKHCINLIDSLSQSQKSSPNNKTVAKPSQEDFRDEVSQNKMRNTRSNVAAEGKAEVSMSPEKRYALKAIKETVTDIQCRVPYADKTVCDENELNLQFVGDKPGKSSFTRKDESFGIENSITLENEVGRHSDLPNSPRKKSTRLMDKSSKINLHKGDGDSEKENATPMDSPIKKNAPKQSEVTFSPLKDMSLSSCRNLKGADHESNSMKAHGNVSSNDIHVSFSETIETNLQTGSLELDVTQTKENSESNESGEDEKKISDESVSENSFYNTDLTRVGFSELIRHGKQRTKVEHSSDDFEVCFARSLENECLPELKKAGNSQGKTFDGMVNDCIKQGERKELMLRDDACRSAISKIKSVENIKLKGHKEADDKSAAKKTNLDQPDKEKMESDSGMSDKGKTLKDDVFDFEMESDIPSDFQCYGPDGRMLTFSKTLAERIKERSRNRQSVESYNMNLLFQHPSRSRSNSYSSNLSDQNAKKVHNMVTKKSKDVVRSVAEKNCKKKMEKKKSGSSIACAAKVVNKYRKFGNNNREIHQNGYQGDDEHDKTFENTDSSTTSKTSQRKSKKFWHYVPVTQVENLENEALKSLPKELRILKEGSAWLSRDSSDTETRMSRLRAGNNAHQASKSEKLSEKADKIETVNNSIHVDENDTISHDKSIESEMSLIEEEVTFKIDQRLESKNIKDKVKISDVQQMETSSENLQDQTLPSNDQESSRKGLKKQRTRKKFWDYVVEPYECDSEINNASDSNLPKELRGLGIAVLNAKELSKTRRTRMSLGDNSTDFGESDPDFSSKAKQLSKESSKSKEFSKTEDCKVDDGYSTEKKQHKSNGKFWHYVEESVTESSEEEKETVKNLPKELRLLKDSLSTPEITGKRIRKQLIVSEINEVERRNFNVKLSKFGQHNPSRKAKSQVSYKECDSTEFDDSDKEAKQTSMTGEYNINLVAGKNADTDLEDRESDRENSEIQDEDHTDSVDVNEHVKDKKAVKKNSGRSRFWEYVIEPVSHDSSDNDDLRGLPKEVRLLKSANIYSVKESDGQKRRSRSKNICIEENVLAKEEDGKIEVNKDKKCGKIDDINKGDCLSESKNGKSNKFWEYKVVEDEVVVDKSLPKELQNLCDPWNNMSSLEKSSRRSRSCNSNSQIEKNNLRKDFPKENRLLISANVSLEASNPEKDNEVEVLHMNAQNEHNDSGLKKQQFADQEEKTQGEDTSDTEFGKTHETISEIKKAKSGKQKVFWEYQVVTDEEEVEIDKSLPKEVQKLHGAWNDLSVVENGSCKSRLRKSVSDMEGDKLQFTSKILKNGDDEQVSRKKESNVFAEKVKSRKEKRRFGDKYVEVTKNISASNVGDKNYLCNSDNESVMRNSCAVKENVEKSYSDRPVKADDQGDKVSSKIKPRKHKVFWDYQTVTDEEVEIDKSLPKELQNLYGTWNDLSEVSKGSRRSRSRIVNYNLDSDEQLENYNESESNQNKRNLGEINKKTVKSDSLRNRESKSQTISVGRNDLHMKTASVEKTDPDIQRGKNDNLDFSPHAETGIEQDHAFVPMELETETCQSSSPPKSLDAEEDERSVSPIFGSFHQSRVIYNQGKTNRCSSPVFKKSPKPRRPSEPNGNKIESSETDLVSGKGLSEKKSAARFNEDQTEKCVDRLLVSPGKLVVKGVLKKSKNSIHHTASNCSGMESEAHSVKAISELEENVAVKNSAPVNKTPEKSKRISPPGSGYSNTPRDKRRKKWKRKKSEVGLDSQERKRRKLEHLKYDVSAVSSSSASSHLGKTGRSVIWCEKKSSPRKRLDMCNDTDTRNVKLVSALSPMQVMTFEKDKEYEMTNSENSALAWKTIGINEERPDKVKLNKSWSMLSERSVSKLLSSDGDCEHFEGFTDEDIEQSVLPSNLSFEQKSEVEIPHASEHEWVLDDETEDCDEDLNRYVPVCFSSPAGKSDPSWADACDGYINNSVRHGPDSSLKEPNSSLYFSFHSPRKSSSKQGTASPLKKACILNSASKVQSPRKSPGHCTPRKKKMSKESSNVEKVDDDIEFNFCSPQKNRAEFSPLRTVNGIVRDLSSSVSRNLTSTPEMKKTKKQKLDKLKFKC